MGVALPRVAPNEPASPVCETLNHNCLIHRIQSALIQLVPQVRFSSAVFLFRSMYRTCCMSRHTSLTQQKDVRAHNQEWSQGTEGLDPETSACPRSFTLHSIFAQKIPDVMVRWERRSACTWETPDDVTRRRVPLDVAPSRGRYPRECARISLSSTLRCSTSRPVSHWTRFASHLSRNSGVQLVPKGRNA